MAGGFVPLTGAGAQVDAREVVADDHVFLHYAT